MMPYNALSKSFHWIIAFLIFGLLSIGFYMGAISFSPFKIQLYGLHKSFGVLVLGLAFLRVLWRFFSKPPAALSTHKTWEKRLAKISHAILYFAIFAMPLSGWVMSSAGGYPASFFGLFELPSLGAKDEDLFELMKEVHEVLAFVIIGVVGLHMAGAFKHHIIDRDETLQRMTSSKLGLWSGLLMGAVLGALLVLPLVIYVFYDRSEVSAPSETAIETNDASKAEEGAGSWVLQLDQSHINFEVLQYGAAFTGEFKQFDGEIIFDPDYLSESVVDIKIDISSIDTGSDDRDEQARSGEWFDVAAFPQAHFVAQGFEFVGANRYLATGVLTLRDVSLPVDLPFSLDIDDLGDGQKRARMRAELTLNRLDFGVGQGQWQTTEAIGNPIKIEIIVEALRGRIKSH